MTGSLEEKMTTVLIVGMSGVLGRYLTLNAPDGWRVVGTFNRNPPPTSHIAYHIDLGASGLGNMRLLDELIAAEKPDLIIHAASPSPLECVYPHQAEMIVGGMHRLLVARSSFAPHSRLLFISHYAVYGSRDDLILEHDPKTPTTEIGKLKLQAEQMVLTMENTTVIRPSWIFGVGWPGGRTGLAQHIYEGLSAARWVLVENNLTAQPIYAGDLARIIWQIALRPEIREVNVGGRDLMSVGDFAKLAARTWGYDPARIEETPCANMERVVFLMMRLYDADIVPNETKDGLMKMKAELMA